jgi:ubiquinone/menaquinone biosynthesis C-methylase UbiE
MVEIGLLHEIRDFELSRALEGADLEPAGKRILEVGSGTGYQLMRLRELGADAVGVDLDSSGYRESRVEELLDYDGKTLPFDDKEFDVIFSSSTLEHISGLEEFQAEMVRVLKDDGLALHIVPTHRWRLWTSIVHYAALPGIFSRRVFPSIGGGPGCEGQVNRKCVSNMFLNALFSSRHGERGNRFTEFWYFRPAWWERHFKLSGWKVCRSFDTGLFYTGYVLAGPLLGIRLRRTLARVFGSPCRVYVLMKG